MFHPYKVRTSFSSVSQSKHSVMQLSTVDPSSESETFVKISEPCNQQGESIILQLISLGFCKPAANLHKAGSVSPRICTTQLAINVFHLWGSPLIQVKVTCEAVQQNNCMSFGNLREHLTIFIKRAYNKAARSLNFGSDCISNRATRALVITKLLFHNPVLYMHTRYTQASYPFWEASPNAWSSWTAISFQGIWV